MQSEKLIRKIRAIMTTSPPDEPEWHSDRIWQKVQQRQKTKQQRFFAWKLAAAAIVIGLIGMLFATQPTYFFNVDSEISNIQKDIEKQPLAAATEAAENGDRKEVKKQIIEVLSTKKHNPGDTTKSRTNRAELASKNEQNTAYKVNIPTADDSTEITNLVQDELPEIRFSITHLKSEDLSPLLDMYRQAQRERENRKMNITLADNRRPIPLWFHANVAFVGRDLNLNNDHFPTFRH